ncbi:MAG: cation-transporting P-type ATPase [Betaproteobacteria bacterium]|nr:cation-transporting P-type ATPase [Betaproteobacteria bacterium]
MMQQAGDMPNKVAPRLWHALPAEETLTAVGADLHGLSEAEARERLASYGPNRLPPPQRRGPLARFVLQFHNVLIYVLLAAAAVTAALGHWIDTGVIVAVVLINAVIGFVQEGKAERAIEAIRSMLSLHALVLRDGRRREIPADELVPGDVVLLASGDKVPADLRLIEVRTLRVEEAALTGESVPVEKSLRPVAEAATIGDRACMAYSGTLITYGQAKGVVVATGARTEIGRISGMLHEVVELATPLTRRMEEFARWLTAAILGSAAVTFAFGLLARDYTAADMFLAVVGLAVAAIPEGLPAIMTITLAIGVQRMARRNAIIRRLPAVETLGSVTVICSDKTGTLTRNEMMVSRVVTADASYSVSGAGYAPEGGFSIAGDSVLVAEHADLVELVRAGLLCNDAVLTERKGAWHLEGDPTEGALVTLALKAGLDPAFEQRSSPRTDVIPFESEHRFMATLHHDHAGHAYSYVKGAPERVLEMCSFERRGGEARPIDPHSWRAAVDRLAAEGQRVLALALRPFEAPPLELRFGEIEQGLVLLGMVGMIDPPRVEAIAAVADCRQAGIRVKMITGDHVVTGRAVGRMLGIGDGTRALGGAEIEQLDSAALRRAARDIDVFARASPEHKLRLVEALQAEGAIVAMTGDGVNDAPALKRAEVGVAMGVKGTEAAKEAAEMVLADDNFASIAHAVEEGRTVYDNLKKAILFILPTNGGEAGVIITAILLGMALPITAVQILWVNMITAVTLALAIAFEPAESNVMRRPPRDPREPLLSGFLVWRIVLVSLLLVAASFGLFIWELERGASIESARTVAVNMLVAGEIFYLFNSRHIYESALSAEGLLGNRMVLSAVGILVVFQAMFTYVPIAHRLFGTDAIDAAAWLRIILCATAIFFVVEGEKWLLRRRLAHV